MSINITIDGKQVSVPEKSTILDACKQIGLEVPVLCYHPDLRKVGSCRLCVVEVEGQRTLQPSCACEVWDGMKVKTNTKEVKEARRAALELILSRHPQDCLKCERNNSCELQKLAADFNMTEIYYPNHLPGYGTDENNGVIVREHDKCINCGRCVRMCQEVQTVNALDFEKRGHEKIASTTNCKNLEDTTCVYCGQCINVCPTGALRENDETMKVWKWLEDPEIHVVVQTAPAIRVGIGEAMGLEHGHLGTGKLVGGLRSLGFDKVFDTDFTADLTIIEEGHELLDRLHKAVVGKDASIKLPMITSCSPGWIKFIETFYGDHVGHLSTCKSPQQMFGALAKTYYPEKAGIDPAKVKCVSIMPCTAKKFECNRPEMKDSGHQDVDVVLTTRELAKMFTVAGINFEKIEDEKYDDPFGITTGAAVIFGATGGVMEAAIRTVYELVTGRPVPFENLDITPVRGLDGVKEATLKLENCVPDFSWLEGVEVKVAITNGLANARMIMDKIKAGEADHHFIEVMCCPGGCIGGGGQPRPTSPEKREARMRSIYAEDAGLELRKSHESPAVAKLYEEFLKKPLGEKSHHLLHTKYIAREWNK